jgi:hypothetical protein
LAKLFIEEYGPKFHYCHGINNVEANTLYRYPCLEGENMNELLFYDDLLLDSFLNYLDNIDNFPLNFPDIAALQVTDPRKQNYATMQGFVYQDYCSVQLLCCLSTDGQWKIVLQKPLSMILFVGITRSGAMLAHLVSMTHCDPLSGSQACVDGLTHTSTHVMLFSITNIKVMAKAHLLHKKMLSCHSKKL